MNFCLSIRNNLPFPIKNFLLIALIVANFYASNLACADDRNSIFYVHNKGCCSELRLYHPNVGDKLLMKLSETPENIFWTKDFGELYYRVGLTFYKLPWKKNSKPIIAARLPEFSAYEPDIWLDTKTNTWRMYFIDFAAINSTGYQANVYDFKPGSKKWEQVASAETHMCEAGDGSACGAEVAKFVKDKGPLILIKDLLDDMRASPNLQKHKTPDSGDPDGKVIRFSSINTPYTGVSMSLNFGDTLHANPPVKWYSSNGKENILFPSRVEGCLSQIAFQESGEWMLVGEEYSMECAILANMSSGEIVYRFPKKAKNAVWVRQQRY